MVIFDQSYPFLARASYRFIILQGDPFCGLWLVQNIQTNRTNQKPWIVIARYFPKSSVARNYHGWITMFSIVRILRFRVIGNFGESKTFSTNHISSRLKSIWFGFYEFLELDRMTNVSNLTACESSSWVIIRMTSSSNDSSWFMTHCFTVLRFERSWSANHISREIYLWPLIGQNSIWSILIGQIQNGQFLLVKTDLLDDYFTVSRNTSNTDLISESYLMTNLLYYSFTMTHHYPIRNAVWSLKSFWL